MEVEKRLFKIDWQYWTQVTQLLSLFDNQITIYGTFAKHNVTVFVKSLFAWSALSKIAKLQKKKLCAWWYCTDIIIFGITLLLWWKWKKHGKWENMKGGKWNWQWVFHCDTQNYWIVVDTDYTMCAILFLFILDDHRLSI